MSTMIPLRLYINISIVNYVYTIVEDVKRCGRGVCNASNKLRRSITPIS